MRFLPVVAVAVTACSSESDVNQNDPPGPQEIECGPNSHHDGPAACVCDGQYDWCTENEEDGCCAWWADEFDVWVTSAKIRPYKDDAGYYPWDWDGDVPDWMIEALDLLSIVYPEASTWAEVLGYVDEYAPELMEGYVPPDPFVWYYLNEDVELGWTSTDLDTYEPEWDEYLDVQMNGNDVLVMWFTDEDVALHDTIEAVGATREDLQILSGRGALTLEDVGRLFEFTIEVEPH